MFSRVTISFVIVFLTAVFLTTITFNDQCSSIDSPCILKIGVLRHLTIEEAEKLSIDTEAERTLMEVALSRGHKIEMVNPLQLICDTNNPINYDVIISRAEIDTFASNITDAYLRALDYFETLGIPVINSSIATLNAQDKFRTLLLAHKAGILVPLTYILYTIEDVEGLLHSHKISFPFFIKKPYGGCGQGVFLVGNKKMLRKILTRNFQSKDPILVEERIDLETDEYGNVKDMRIWVVRDSITDKAKLVDGMYRIAAHGHYLTNVSKGGSVSPMCQPYDEKVVAISQQALESIKADVAGIDLARDKKGNIYLLEINIGFHTSKISQQTMNNNIWEFVVDLAESKVRQKKLQSNEGWPCQLLCTK